MHWAKKKKRMQSKPPSGPGVNLSGVTKERVDDDKVDDDDDDEALAYKVDDSDHKEKDKVDNNDDDDEVDKVIDDVDDKVLDDNDDKEKVNWEAHDDSHKLDAIQEPRNNGPESSFISLRSFVRHQQFP
jgi:hypothetical protein